MTYHEEAILDGLLSEFSQCEVAQRWFACLLPHEVSLLLLAGLNVSHLVPTPGTAAFLQDFLQPTVRKDGPKIIPEMSEELVHSLQPQWNSGF